MQISGMHVRKEPYNNIKKNNNSILKLEWGYYFSNIVSIYFEQQITTLAEQNVKLYNKNIEKEYEIVYNK